ASQHRLLMLLLFAGPAAVAAAAVGGWWLSRAALAPVSRMTEEASQIGIGQLDKRIDVPSGSDEVQRLAFTLNTMLDRLHSGIEDRRRFMTDASHQLRTPVAVMRAELDVRLEQDDLDADAREALSSAREELERIEHTVEDMLTLARVEEG